MWSKRFKSAMAVLLAGSVIATIPAVSASAAVTANAASVLSATASQNDWYYSVVPSATLAEGEYVFYNTATKTIMTDTLDVNNHSFPSYKTGGFSYYTSETNVPKEFRYKIKSAGNGSYYIINSDGLYLDIVRYGNLKFTSTPSPLEFEAVNGDYAQFIIKKKVNDQYYAISMYSNEWFTVHDYDGDKGQVLVPMKYDKDHITLQGTKLSDYNIQDYDKDREFTPKRDGDTYDFSRNELKMAFGFSNRIATGIWATPGETLKIYVQADGTDPVPRLLFTQHISKGSEIREISLKRGLNTITVPTLYSDFSSYETPTEPGGCIYIVNPYTETEQSSNVKVYIEGGDKVPVFRKGDNVRDFITELKDYYAKYQAGQKGYHNVVELTSKHTLFTLTLTRVYEGYVTNGLDPQAASEAWDAYMERLFEFGGLTPEQYNTLMLPIKINQPYGGAYASGYGFMGIQDGDMSAAALTASRRGWGYSHETGHILDVAGRCYAEVTNNMWAMSYGIPNETLYDIAIPKRASEMTPLAQNETNSLWQTSPSTNFWTLSMFWDLEVYHNGYWAELDTMFRKGTCGNSAIDNYVNNMSVAEKVAVYSSKIVGIDLTYYFKRYGYLTDTSVSYKNAITALSLSKLQPKFWYYDDYAYNMPLNTNIGITGTVEASCDKSSKSIYFTISDSYKDAHLGFEIIKDGKVIDFTWDYRYITEDSGDYTVNAYDRSLNVYKTITFNYSYNPQQFMAHCGNSYYSSIKQAVDAAPDGGIIYIDKTASIEEQVVIDGKSVTIMPYDKNKKIVVYNHTGTDPFIIKNGGSLTIKTDSDKDDMFVFDGQKQNYARAFTLSDNSSLTLGKGVTLRRFYMNNAGAAVYCSGSKLNLKGCIIEYNSSTYATLWIGGGSVLNSSDNTIFRQNRTDYSSSAFYTYDGNDKAYIKDTVMYKNFSVHPSTGSTIYVRGGYVSIGNGTSIYSNISDWYNLQTVFIRKGGKVEFSGKLDITDMVTTEEKLSINPQVSGVLNIRTAPSFTGVGNVVAVPTSGSFPKSITNVVKYNHNIYSIINKTDSLVIADIMPLQNNSRISATSVDLGKSVTVKAVAAGGDGNYTYAFYYKKASDTKWTTKQDFKSNATVSVTPADEGKYNICVKVKDGTGAVEKKYFDVTVKKVALTLDASVKTTTSPFVVLGHTFTATGTAKGGTGSYTYAFFYKQKAQTKWTTKQNFSTKNSVSIKPAKATDYDVCVKAKDKAGTVVKKYFTVKVRMPVSLNVTIPTTAKLGKTISVKAEVSGGLEPYTYAFYYRKRTDTKWVTKQDFKTNNSVAIKPANAAEYEICVKVKDSVGTVYKKYFYVKVSK